MEILKRAKSGGELVSSFHNEKDLRDEVNRRTAKAGYTTRDGQPISSTKIITTSGFGETKIRNWPRDPVTGELL